MRSRSWAIPSMASSTRSVDRERAGQRRQLAQVDDQLAHLVADGAQVAATGGRLAVLRVGAQQEPRQQQLHDRRQRDGEDRARDAQHRRERGDRQQRDQRVGADRPHHHARDQHVVLEQLQERRPPRRRRAPATARPTPRPCAATTVPMIGPDDRDRLADRVDDADDAGVRQPDQPVDDEREHADDQADQRLPAQVGADRALDLGDEAADRPAAIERREQHQRAHAALALQRPVEPEQQHGDDREQVAPHGAAGVEDGLDVERGRRRCVRRRRAGTRRSAAGCGSPTRAARSRSRSKWWGARATSVAVCSATTGTASVSTPAPRQPSAA